MLSKQDVATPVQHKLTNTDQENGGKNEEEDPKIEIKVEEEKEGRLLAKRKRKKAVTIKTNGVVVNK